MENRTRFAGAMEEGKRAHRRALPESRTLKKTATRKQRSVPGFLLLEAVIVLCIVGVLFSVLLPLVRLSIRQSQTVKTQQAFDRVLKALALYAESNKRLPFPAKTDDGLEDFDFHQNPGLLPYKTLGIEKSWVQDGFGNVLLYAVTPELTAWIPQNPLDSEKNDFWDRQAPTAIQVSTGDGRVLFPKGPDQKDFCAFVLISFPPHSKQDIRSVIYLNSTSLHFRIPAPQSNINVRWTSRNNLRVFLP
jgi:type II secretory pathway pseudopilin PulG